jgi:hypothetical protein
MEDDDIVAMKDREEDFKDLSMKNKVAPRDQAKLLSDFAKLEIYGDNLKNGKIYTAITGDELHIPVLVDTELDDLMKGVKILILIDR